MKVPYSWLCEFVDLSGISAEEVADRLSLQSVEAFVDTCGVPVSGVVIGKVVEVTPLSGSKNLNLVKVIIKSGDKLSVVTADENLSEGVLVVVATPGAKVEDRSIEKKSFGEHVSEGVLLSPQDLGFEESSDEVIKIYEDLPLDSDVNQLLGLGEKVIELDITPNRGDVLSVRGLARDVAAIFRLERLPEAERGFEEKGTIPITIEDKDCKRYRGAVIEGVKIEPSPLWLRKRLWQCGIKAINNVVDITNYVLLREGQPLHAFDLDTLEGGIKVRSASKGEKIKALDFKEYELDPDILVIADDKKPVAIAGVIGGLDSSVTEATKNILLEAAYFDPKRVRKGSKKLGIQTDSSYRFERNTDIELLPKAQNLAISMILELAGGSLAALNDEYPEPYEPKKIFMSAGKYERYSGSSYDKSEVREILSRLEIPCELKRCGIEAEVPAHRSFDIHRDVDLIEEVMRVNGYDSYLPQVINLPVKGYLEGNRLSDVRKLLRDKGLHEVINISFEEDEIYKILGISPPEVEIVNPLVPSQRFMRSSLIPSLIRNAQINLKNYNSSVSLFEIGNVYLKGEERLRLGILLSGIKKVFPREERWSHEDLLEVLYSLQKLLGVELETGHENTGFTHPYVSAGIYFQSSKVGFLGKLSPKVADALEVNTELYLLELELEPLLRGVHRTYKPISKFPPVIRDLAILVDKEISVLKLINEIKSHISGMVEDIMVFDFYTGEKLGEGKKSVGVRLVLRSLDRSLTDEEVNQVVENLLRRLEDSFGAVLR